MELKRIHPMFMGLSLAWRLAIVSGIIVMTILLADWLFFRPARLQQAATTAKAETTVAKGETAKAADAARIVENTHEILRTIERTTITNERTIRAAEGADAPMAPDVVRAGRAALCLRHAYKLHPACHQLPGTDPASVAAADAGRQPAAG